MCNVYRLDKIKFSQDYNLVQFLYIMLTVFILISCILSQSFSDILHPDRDTQYPDRNRNERNPGIAENIQEGGKRRRIKRLAKKSLLNENKVCFELIKDLQQMQYNVSNIKGQ